MPNHSPGWNLKFISKNFTCPEVLADVRPESACSLPASPLKRLSLGDELCGHLVTNVTEYPRALKSPRISPPQGSAGGPNSGGEAGAGAVGWGCGAGRFPDRGAGAGREVGCPGFSGVSTHPRLELGLRSGSVLLQLRLCPLCPSAPPRASEAGARGPQACPQAGAQRGHAGRTAGKAAGGVRLEWVAPRSRGRLRRVMEVRTL